MDMSVEVRQRVSWSLPDKLLLQSRKRAADKVVILIGWWGATERSVQKFAKVYADYGLTVCQFIPYGSETFLGAAKRRAVASALLDEIRHRCDEIMQGGTDGNQFQPQPSLIFHVMSNNGATLYTSILECSENDQRHQWVSKATSGTVFDCAPGDLTFPIFFKAFLAGRPPLSVRLPLFGAGIGLSLATLYASLRQPISIGFPLLCFIFYTLSKADQFNRCYHEKLASDPSRCPQLFLYSTKDALVGYGVIEWLIARRRKCGVDVSVKRWNDVPHMALLRDRPSEYEEALRKYISSLQFSS
eukprot:TRINITY_DN6769_c0_g1_i2.p1 TRINITY_DN6769_c0_g1~~TRINITY_DN6769_c0_g1_i2.p1  ORF type:complete len:324 (+),score=36.01 TRINITY_DN6769_c0_g1_i2:72-974(+)